MAARRMMLPDYGTVSMKGTQYYRTRVTDQQGRRVSLYARTREELYQKEQEAIQQIENKTYRRSTPTVEEYCEKWLLMQSAQIRMTTLIDYTSKVKNYIIKPLGDMHMGDVTADDIRLALLAASKKSASVYKSVNVLYISSREPETELSASSEESAGAAADLALRAAEHHEKKTARKAEKADTQAVRDGSAARQRPSSRLQFTEEERADPALGKYIDRSDRAADRLDAAKAAIPTKKVLRTERVFDETAGKGKTQLHFEEVEKRPNGRLRHNPLSRPVHEIVHAAHAKVHEVEQENVGVEAGHKGEVLTERGLTYGKGKVRAAVHHHRTKPWRDAAKAEQAFFKANADYLYQKALHDDPVLAASNPISRFLQKQRIKRNYSLAAASKRMISLSCPRRNFSLSFDLRYRS